MLRYIFCLIIAAGLFISCAGEAGESKAEQATVVRLSKVTHKKAVFPVSSSGRLAAKKEVHLSLKTGGIINAFTSDEGDHVKKGQTLAILDMDEVNAHVRQAQSAYNKAQRDHQRVSNLFADSAASLEQLQNVETALKVAGANLKIAQFNARYSTISAPFNGRILKRYMNSGEMVNAGMPVMSIAADQENWVVRVEVSDRDITRINLNDSAKVTFDAYPDQVFLATVSEKAAGASPLSGLFEIELLLTNPRTELFSGFIATVEIYPGDAKKMAFIPVKALNGAAQKKGFVYLLNKQSDKAQKREISIVHILDDSVAVDFGLENISYVISEGTEYLSDGKSVLVEN